MQTLESWTEKFGSNEEFTAPSRTGNFQMELNIAYPMCVKRARVSTSQRGKRQLELGLNILKGDDVVGETRTWLELPKQPATDGSLPGEVLRKIVLRRRDDLIRIYAAAQPKQFSIYKERRMGDNGRYQYIGHNDQPLTPEEYKARERQIYADMLAYGDELFQREGEEVDELVDAFFYMAKIPNPKKPDYPYINYFSLRPEKLAIFGE